MLAIQDSVLVTFQLQENKSQSINVYEQLDGGLDLNIVEA